MARVTSKQRSRSNTRSTNSLAKPSKVETDSDSQQLDVFHSASFATGDKVQGYWRGLWYPAKVIDVAKDEHPDRPGEEVPCFAVHYDNFRVTYDEWVFGDVLMLDTEENRAVATKENEFLLEQINKKKGVKVSRKRRNSQNLEAKEESLRETRSSSRKDPYRYQPTGVVAWKKSKRLSRASQRIKSEPSERSQRTQSRRVTTRSRQATRGRRRKALNPRRISDNVVKVQSSVEKKLLKMDFDEPDPASAETGHSVENTPSAPKSAIPNSDVFPAIIWRTLPKCEPVQSLAAKRRSRADRMLAAVGLENTTDHCDEESTTTVVRPCFSGARRSTGPELKTPPFFKTFSHYAVRGVSLLQHKSLLCLGLHRQITLDFTVDTVMQSVLARDPSSCLLIRFCQNSPVSLVTWECHPKELILHLNSTIRLIQSGRPTSDQSSKECRFFAPIILTTEILEEDNELRIEWTDDATRIEDVQDFLVFVEVAKKLDLQAAMRNVCDQSLDVRDSVAKFHTIISTMKSAGQSSLTYSLVCPITQRRFDLPIRGKTCRHLECFDADAYVTANQSRQPLWACPICQRCVLMDDLIVDEYVRVLLAFTKQNSVLLLSREDKVDLIMREISQPSGSGGAASSSRMTL